MSLTREDVQAMDLSKVRAEIDRQRNEVASLREKNGGTIVGMTGDDAQKVTEGMQSLDMLAERRDELVQQTDHDAKFETFQSYFERAAEQHPGHPATKIEKPLRDAQVRDIGGLFLESSAFKEYKEEGRKDRVVTLPVESLWKNYRGIGEVPAEGLRMQSTLFQSTDYPIQPEFLAQPVETLYQANNIGPLFAQGTTTQTNAIRYVTETVTATGAAEVAEAGTKPEAQLAFSAVDEPLRKIAVLLPLTDESFSDVGLLRAYINARLRLFVQMREDAQLLNGNGTAPNLRGILNRSGINTATSYSIGGANPDQALIDSVFKAAMRVRDSYLEPDAVVMKPSTWEIARLAKDGNRNYLLGPAADNAPARLWGLRVVLNANMPAQVATNKVALVGAFGTSAMLIRNGGIELAVSDSHGTFFAENKVMLRAEERVALAVFRAAGFATVTSAA